jgi:hypothetical protein
MRKLMMMRVFTLLAPGHVRLDHGQRQAQLSEITREWNLQCINT